MLLRVCRKYFTALSICNEGGFHLSTQKQLAPETLSVLQGNVCNVRFCRHNHASNSGNKEFRKIIKRPEPKDFYERLEFYRDAAQRSVLVVLDKESMISSCQQACDSFGPFRMNQVTSSDSNYLKFLVTFNAKESATEFLTSVNTGINFPTRVVGFGCDMNNRKYHYRERGKKVQIPNKSSLENQMTRFSELCKSSQTDILKRFFVCQYIEDLVRTINPSLMVIPFGSSVSNLGSTNGDLDMSLEITSKEAKHSPWKPETGKIEIMQSIQKLVNVCLPSFRIVLAIPHAVVPILKFHHRHVDAMCDLSFKNSEGVHMTSWLYTMTQYDERFPVLARVIKEWARNHLPTIKNSFFLQLMMVFFLQMEKVLPPLEDMMLEDFDKEATSLLRKYSWKMDIPSSANEKTVDVLLKEFFQFYSTLDFTNNEINLQNGCLISRTDVSKMFMPNPFVPEKSSVYNVCRNIQGQQVNQIKNKMNKTLKLWNQSECPNLQDIIYIKDTKKESTVKKKDLESPVEVFKKEEPVAIN